MMSIRWRTTAVDSSSGTTLTVSLICSHAGSQVSVRILYCRGKKITCPGAPDKLNFRQDKHIFSRNVLRTSTKFTDSLFFLDKDKLFGNRINKNFDVLARGTSENF